MERFDPIGLLRQNPPPVADQIAQHQAGPGPPQKRGLARCQLNRHHLAAGERKVVVRVAEESFAARLGALGARRQRAAPGGLAVVDSQRVKPPVTEDEDLPAASAGHQQLVVARRFPEEPPGMQVQAMEPIRIDRRGDDPAVRHDQRRIDPALLRVRVAVANRAEEIRHPLVLHLLFGVAVSPEERPRRQLDCDDRAVRRRADEHSVGIGGGNARHPAERVVEHALLDDGKLLLPDQAAAGGVDRQKANLSIDLRNRVQVAQQRQWRAEEEGPCQRQSPLHRVAAELPAQLPLGPQVIGRQPVVGGGRARRRSHASRRQQHPRVARCTGQLQILDGEHQVAVAGQGPISRVAPQSQPQSRGQIALEREAPLGRRIQGRVERIIGGDFPKPLAGFEIHGQQIRRRAHQDHVAHNQRMQAGQQGQLALFLLLLETADHLLDFRLVRRGNAPADVQQRRAAAGAGVALRPAATHRPVSRPAGVDRHRLAQQGAEPIDRVIRLPEQGDLAPLNLHAAGRVTVAQRGERLAGGLRHPGLEPTTSHRQAQRGLETVRAGRFVAEPPEGQCGDQRAPLVHVMHANQVRRFVARHGVKIPPRHLGHQVDVARLDGFVQAPPRDRAVLEFIRLKAARGHRAQQPPCLRFEAAMDRRIAVGLEEIVLRPAKDRVEAADRFGIPALVDQQMRPVEQHQQAPFGRHEDRFGRLSLRRVSTGARPSRILTHAFRAAAGGRQAPERQPENRPGAHAPARGCRRQCA